MLFIYLTSDSDAVKVILVGTIVPFNRTSLSVKEYDGIYNYECEVGDTIDITCSNLYENGYITLQFHDAQGNITVKYYIIYLPHSITVLVRRSNIQLENRSDLTFLYRVNE